MCAINKTKVALRQEQLNIIKWKTLRKENRINKLCDNKIMGRALTFKQKEVINLNDGKRLGYVQDVEADFESGEITAIVVPGTPKLFSVGNKNDIVIPWSKIKRIGEDIILVEMN